MANININLSNIDFTTTAFSLVDGLTLEKIKVKYNWILNAVIENAIIGEDDYGLIWYTGNWIAGTWYDGTWYNGNFVDGRWKNGNFYSYNVIYDKKYNTLSIDKDNSNYHSFFQNGTWYKGNFYGGCFGNLIIKNDIILDDKTTLNDIYYNVNKYNIVDYKFLNELNSEIRVSIWKDGLFYNGLVQNSIWENGNFYNGIIFNSIWENGNFFDGIFADKYWLNGNFYGGNFSSGIWENGKLSKKSKDIICNFGTNLQNVEYYKEYHDTSITLTTDWYYPTNIIDGNNNGNIWTDIESDTLFLSTKCLINNNNNITNTLEISNFIDVNTNKTLFDELSVNCKIESIDIEICKKSNLSSNTNDNILLINNGIIDENFDLNTTNTLWYSSFTTKVYKLKTNNISYNDIENIKLKYEAKSNSNDTLLLNYIRIKINYFKYYPENIVSMWENGVWENGNFYAGQETDNFKIKNRMSIWSGGTWVNGNFYAGQILSIQWENGNFYYGEFLGGINNSIWFNGFFHNGVFDGLWHRGTIYNGMMLNSTIYGGTLMG